MALDQNITYRVNVDDSNFQAKLTQMRASLDATLGGSSNFGNTLAYMGPMGNFGGGGQNFSSPEGGFFQSGLVASPVSYTPTAIAMQPHFGMFQIQQTLTQAGLASGFGPYGMGALNLAQNGLSRGRDFVPPNMSYYEYAQYSTRSLGDKMAAGMTAISGAGSMLAAGTVGTAAASLVTPAAWMAEGAGIGGMIGAGAIGMAGASLAVAPVAMAVDRAAENLAIQSSLANNSFRFYQGSDVDPTTGRGFGRMARSQIATAIQGMESRDNRLDIGDYKAILDTGGQMDMFSGTRDVEDFKTKFKSLVDTVKVVSSTLHTSLKDGIEAIRSIRDMGVTDPIAQQGMILGSEVLGRASGKTGLEMMQIGQAGAEIFRGTGISMKTGFELNQRNTMLIQQQLLNSNDPSARELVSQAGGAASLSQKMTAAALASTQTVAARAFLAATADLDHGTVDMAKMGRLMTKGTMAGAEMAAENLSSPGAVLAFQAKMPELINSMGPAGLSIFMSQQIMSQAQMFRSAGMLGNLTGKDAYVQAGLNMGLADREVLEANYKIITADPTEMRKNLNQQMGNAINQSYGEFMRDKYGYKAIPNWINREIIDPIANTWTRQAGQMASDLEYGLTSLGHYFKGDVDTRHTNAGAVAAARESIGLELDAVKRKAQAEGRSESEIRGIVESESRRLVGRGMLMTDESHWWEEKSTSKKLYDKIKGRGKVGGTVEEAGLTFRVFGSEEDRKKFAEQSGESWQEVGGGDGKYYAVSDSAVQKLSQQKNMMFGNPEEVKAAQEKYSKFSKADQLELRRSGVLSFDDLLKRMQKEKGDKWGSSDEAELVELAGKMGWSEDAEKRRSRDDISGLLLEGSRSAGAMKRSVMEDIFSSGSSAMGLGLGGEALSLVWNTESKKRSLHLQEILESGNKDDLLQAINALGVGKKTKDSAVVSQAMANFRKLGAADIGEELEKNYGSEQTSKLMKSVEEYDRLQMMSERSQATRANTEAGAASGMVGGLTGQQMQAILVMSQSIETQIQTIINMHNQLKSVLGAK